MINYVTICISFLICVASCTQNNKVALSDSLNNYDGLYVVSKDCKFGLINASGEIIVDYIYDKIDNFSEGLAAFKHNKKYGFLNEKGEIVIEPQFENVGKFESGLCSVYETDSITGKWYKKAMIRMDGSVAFIPQHKFSKFNDGLARIKIDEHIAFIDTTGTVVFESTFKYGSEFDHGLVQLWWVSDSGYWQQNSDLSRTLIEDRRTIYFNTSGDTVLDIKGWHGLFHNGYGQLHFTEKKSVINSSGEVVIDSLNPNWNYGYFNEGYSTIKTKVGEVKFGFIDSTGKVIIAPKYEELNEFRSGLAAFRIGSKWGFINTSGMEVIKPKFKDVKYAFRGELCLVKEDEFWEYINKKGKVIWKSDFIADNPYDPMTNTECE